MFIEPSATLVASLGSDVKNGLSHEEAERRLAANGHGRAMETSLP